MCHPLQDIRCQDTNIGLQPKDNFRVPICKQVLDLHRKWPQPVTFFRKEFKDLQEIVVESFNKYYLGQHKLCDDGAVEVITKSFGTAKLPSLIDAVYDSDGNFTEVVVRPKRRTELVQAVIVRMVHVRVFTPLLFGGNLQQCQKIAEKEASLASDNSLEGRERSLEITERPLTSM